MAVSGLLAGRLALITGAGSGIGKAVCQVFAREGAILAAVDVNQDSAHQTIDSLPKDRTHHAFCADVSSSGSINELMQNIQSAFKEIPTIAVNSAGITKDAMMLKMSEENFDRVIDVNLKGTFLLNQAVSRAIIGASIKNGSIVNISSIVGKVGNIGQANYAATKAGVIGLTKTAAKELAGHGIRVNAILPGFVETPMTNVVPEKVIEKMKVLIPQGRLGKPEEIAEACLYLASDKSSYVTGAALEVTDTCIRTLTNIILRQMRTRKFYYQVMSKQTETMEGKLNMKQEDFFLSKIYLFKMTKESTIPQPDYAQV